MQIIIFKKEEGEGEWRGGYWQGQFFIMMGPFILKVITKRNNIKIMQVTKKTYGRNIKKIT
jgi:hypothetical protein